MTIDEILKVTNGKLICGKNNKIINHFEFDTRKIKKGDCFIALKGSKYDGHDYISNIICKAGLIIVCENISVKTNIPIIKVEDTYKCLFDLAKFMRDKYKIPCIAVTGSNGKTTTKELIYEILSLKYNVLKTEGNYNNHIGVPYTCLKLNESYDLFITELGMNHLNEISRLSKLVCPDIGIITNISSSHIGNLKNQKNILKAKLEITDGMEDGIVFVNGQNKYLKKIRDFRFIKVGKESLKPTILKSTLEETVFEIRHNGEKYTIKFNYPKIILSDILLAIEVGLFLDIPMNDMIRVIENFKMSNHRMNIIKKECIIIDDTYNSNFESLKESLLLLQKERKDKIIILGDILELGKYHKKYHKRINNLLKKIKNKKVLLVGKSTLYIKGIHFNSNKNLIEYLSKINCYNKIIFIKGSRKMYLDEVANYLKEEV